VPESPRDCMPTSRAFPGSPVQRPASPWSQSPAPVLESRGHRSSSSSGGASTPPAGDPPALQQFLPGGACHAQHLQFRRQASADRRSAPDQHRLDCGPVDSSPVYPGVSTSGNTRVRHLSWPERGRVRSWQREFREPVILPALPAASELTLGLFRYRARTDFRHTRKSSYTTDDAGAVRPQIHNRF
jgi:hypothetical protein